MDPDDPVYVSYTKNFPGEPTGKDNPELLRMLPSHGHDQSIVNGISRIGYMKGGKSALWKDEDIADSITAHAIRFIEKSQQSKEPFFLYLATNDIHVPRVPHKRFAGKSGLGPRGDALLSFDWTVGQVMETLKKLNLDDNTIVISNLQVRYIDNVIEHVLIMDESRVLLDESTSSICEKLFFVESDDRELAQTALFAIPTIQGNYLILPNKEKEESDINLELLFNATLAAPEEMARLFQTQK